MFIDSQENYNGDIPRYKNLFNLTEVNELLATSVSNYYHMNTNDTLEDYVHYLNSSQAIEPPLLYLEYASYTMKEEPVMYFPLYEGEEGLGVFS